MPEIPDQRHPTLAREIIRHPGLDPGPSKKASELRFAPSPSSRACPGN